MKTNSKKFSIKDWFEKNKLYILEEKKLKELKEKWKMQKKKEEKEEEK